MVRSAAGGDAALFQGGFITFPQATFKADSAGVIRSEPNQQDLVTDATPALHGAGGVPFYDLAMKRWVPVGSNQTSPDGAFYAYTTDPTQIHIVDVARASDRVVTLQGQPQGSIQIVDFDSRGVEFLYTSYHQLAGVWRLDPASGSVTRIAALDFVDLVSNGYAWISAFDPRDPSPPSQPNSRLLFDSVVRVDLATGAKTVWYYARGFAVIPRGLDLSGNPIVDVAAPPDFDFSAGDIRLASPPGSPGADLSAGLIALSDPQRDVGRLWFGNGQGIYVHTGDGGTQKVFALASSSSLAGYWQPVGYCV